MSIKPRQLQAFTLTEILVACGLGSVLLMAVGMLSMYSSRSFAAMSNYVSLEQSSQLALDKMSQELRQARGLTDFSPTRLRVLDADNLPVEFFHDAGSRTVMRVAGGATNNYLTDCDSLQFSVYQHTVQSNTFECYNPLYLADARVIQITWVCSRKILGAKANTESVQSARVAFRNRN